MSSYNLEELTKFANSLADASGEIVRKYYRNFGDIIDKADTSPVTIADKQAEMAIKQLISQHYPLHGVIGEEFGAENEAADFKWVIDPIDGTASFMIGRPIFGTLLALLYKEKPILGIIDQPINAERWVGVLGGKSQLNGKEISVRPCASLAKAIICTTGPQYFSADKLLKVNNIIKNVKHIVYGGDCYNYGLLACGMVDCVIESGLKLHDFMALKVVVEQAGGIATDWQGRPLNIHSNGDVVFSGDKIVHDAVLAMLG